MFILYENTNPYISMRHGISKLGPINHCENVRHQWQLVNIQPLQCDLFAKPKSRARVQGTAILRFTTDTAASILLKPTHVQHAKALDPKTLECTETTQRDTRNAGRLGPQ